MDEFVVAIDGPSGVGKTSVSRAIASALGCEHLDTGAFYRAATVVALINRTDLSVEASVLAAVAQTFFGFSDGIMTVEGIDVSAAIRSDAVNEAVSRVAAYPSVRRVLVAQQRKWVAAHDGRAVVEGRDIGTVVFADSAHKFYLTARPEIRAARRAGEDPHSNDIGAIQDLLERRDTVDSQRAASPLAAAEDAVVIDTSDITQAEVVEALLAKLADSGLTP